MMLKNFMIVTIVTAMCIALLLGSCTNKGQITGEVTQPLIPLLNTETRTSTPENYPSETIRIIPTQTLSSTPTNSPTLTSTPIPTTTATPLPTLSPREAEEFALELFETNRGCRLPCWWGFTPGRTSWQEARNFLAQFVEFNSTVDQTKPLFEMDILVPVPEEIFSIPLPHHYLVEKGIITAIVLYLGNAPTYSLSSFLETYGPPSAIWLETYSSEYPVGSVLPFLTILFYPDQGILALFGPAHAYFAGDMVRACQWGDPPGKFGLWSPEQKLEFIEAARLFRFNPDVPGFRILPIEQATEIDVQTFYEIFKEPGSDVCLETPRNLWPSQF